jgi:hypothetical protein
MKKLICLVAFAAVGCQGAGSLYRSEGYKERPSINASLVRDEQAMLSEEAIQKLLSSRIRIPDRVKLAVLPLGHTGTLGEVRFWNQDSQGLDFPQQKKAYLEALEAPLAATGRFSEITHVPAMMLPPQPSLTRLREAAALMQAELLLVYFTESHLVYRHLVFARDEVRALASIELILLDVRTGVVPYAETFHAEHLETERSKDLSIIETQRRCERKATLIAMGRAAEGLKGIMAP